MREKINSSSSNYSDENNNEFLYEYIDDTNDIMSKSPNNNLNNIHNNLMRLDSQVKQSKSMNKINKRLSFNASNNQNYYYDTNKDNINNNYKVSNEYQSRKERSCYLHPFQSKSNDIKEKYINDYLYNPQETSDFKKNKKNKSQNSFHNDNVNIKSHGFSSIPLKGPSFYEVLQSKELNKMLYNNNSKYKNNNFQYYDNTYNLTSLNDFSNYYNDIDYNEELNYFDSGDNYNECERINTDYLDSSNINNRIEENSDYYNEQFLSTIKDKDLYYLNIEIININENSCIDRNQETNQTKQTYEQDNMSGRILENSNRENMNTLKPFDTGINLINDYNSSLNSNNNKHSAFNKETKHVNTKEFSFRNKAKKNTHTINKNLKPNKDNNESYNNTQMNTNKHFIKFTLSNKLLIWKTFEGLFSNDLLNSTYPKLSFLSIEDKCELFKEEINKGNWKTKKAYKQSTDVNNETECYVIDFNCYYFNKRENISLKLLSNESYCDYELSCIRIHKLTLAEDLLFYLNTHNNQMTRKINKMQDILSYYDNSIYKLNIYNEKNKNNRIKY